MNKTIAYITDIHLDETFVLKTGVDPRVNWIQLLEDVRGRGIDTIIYGGDIGEAAAHAWFFDSLSAFTLDITLGNHDTFAETSQHFSLEEWKGKTEGYYSREDASFKYLFLDSSTDVVSKEQKYWLQKETATDKPMLLFIHHPIFEVETIVDKAYPLKNRSAIQSILQLRTAASYIFCGHYHMEDEQQIGLIQQCITPAASYQIVKEAADLKIDKRRFGYRLLHLDNALVTSEVIWFENDHNKNL